MFSSEILKNDINEINVGCLSTLNDSNIEDTIKHKLICGFCNRRFIYTSSLSIHLQGHTGIISLNCDKCLKTYSSVSSLYVHYRVHTGEKMSES